MAGYLARFGLKLAPFSTIPDPEFACATRGHPLAIAKIQYVVDERQGAFLLQEDNGTGKTTISEFLLNNWGEDKALEIAYLPNPAARTPSHFLRLLLSSYGQESPRLQQDCWNALRSRLFISRCFIVTRGASLLQGILEDKLLRKKKYDIMLPRRKIMLPRRKIILPSKKVVWHVGRWSDT